MIFADILKDLRREKHITQMQLSEATKIPRSTIGMYETGHREPQLEELEAIADYFNVDIAYLRGKQVEKKIINISSNVSSLNLSDELIEELMKLDTRQYVLVLAYLKALNGEV